MAAAAGTGTETDTRTLRSGGHTVTVRRAGKVLFPGRAPGEERTKADLAAYYRGVAPYMVPRLRGRPLMLERCPDGVDGQRFMQKDTPDHYPDWITRATVPAQTRQSGTVTHTVCDSTATLLFLADQACLTLHRWAARADALDEPDLLVFDLDPPGDSAEDFETVRTAAQLLHGLFDDIGLPSAAMTTGSRGLHVVVPVDGRDGFDAVRDFARQVADALAGVHPDMLTTAVRKEARRGRLYLDIQRNAYAQTSVAPWSVRARAGAPVAAPVTWEQVRDPAVGARSWTMDNALEQVRSKPWDGLPARGRALGPALRRLREWEKQQDGEQP